MEKDLNLDSSQYSIILSIFFVVSRTRHRKHHIVEVQSSDYNQSYLLFEVPSNMILARSKPSIFLPVLMLSWGALSVGVQGINSFAGMVAFRFALGIIEAGL